MMMQVMRLLDGSAPIDMHSRAFQGALLFLCPEALRREPHAPLTYKYEPLTGSCHLIALISRRDGTDRVIAISSKFVLEAPKAIALALIRALKGIFVHGPLY